MQHQWARGAKKKNKHQKTVHQVTTRVKHWGTPACTFLLLWVIFKRKVNRNVNLKPEDAHCFLPLPLINLCLLWFSPLSFKHHLAVPLVQFLSLPVHPSQMLWSDYIPPQLKNIQWLPTTNRTMTFSTWFQPNFPILFTSIFVNFIFQQASIEKLSYARAILSGV